jgi:hypothetical protein
MYKGIINSINENCFAQLGSIKQQLNLNMNVNIIHTASISLQAKQRLKGKKKTAQLDCGGLINSINPVLYQTCATKHCKLLCQIVRLKTHVPFEGKS